MDIKDLKNLKRDELLKLKGDINALIKYIDTLKDDVKVSKEKNSLSNLVKGDKIFCINFRESTIFHMDFVEINFYKSKGFENSEWINFSTNHETKPLGCSSSIHVDSMNNHCFLSEFSNSHMYFYTLKPESWKLDLDNEIDRNIKLKKKNFDNEIRNFKRNAGLIIESKEVDNFLRKIL